MFASPVRVLGVTLPRGPLWFLRPLAAAMPHLTQPLHQVCPHQGHYTSIPLFRNIPVYRLHNTYTMHRTAARGLRHSHKPVFHYFYRSKCLPFFSFPLLLSLPCSSPFHTLLWNDPFLQYYLERLWKRYLSRYAVEMQVYTLFTQFTPPAQPDKTVESDSAWLDFGDRLNNLPLPHSHCSMNRIANTREAV